MARHPSTYIHISWCLFLSLPLDEHFFWGKYAFLSLQLWFHPSTEDNLISAVFVCGCKQPEPVTKHPLAISPLIWSASMPLTTCAIMPPYYNAGTKPLTRYVMKPGQNQMVGRPTSEHPILLCSNPTKCKTVTSFSDEAGNLITLVFPAYLSSDRCCSKLSFPC